ncbi:hypothetical protein [Methylobacterium gnaphalii]|uniref:Uncharacterized protein n=1 Tax=Methylobacterium gnaphalii TaxID=1010610 RepID=A0A512JQG6_9HYPH|nr:hypothetical protein [Methylobacterium gnaphalii]GEP12198.1 hypothetical protein MGN01_40430 [Methylobacterium gnaphalii]GJD67464.1 hypothetical protein MMMDOFMJ_0379 [Methylobacterium gnaphalii]GLS51320.1 hypothetical protein GCM10007885_41750 [Methylobacterium gnaphalii]
MSSDASKAASDRAEAIVQAYAVEAKPPLTQDLKARLHAILAAALDPALPEESVSAPLDRLNAAIDGFEAELRSVVGPRVKSLDEAIGSVTMEHRSEAGQPLRAFGGQ